MTATLSDCEIPSHNKKFLILVKATHKNSFTGDSSVFSVKTFLTYVGPGSIMLVIGGLVDFYRKNKVFGETDDQVLSVGKVC